MPPLSDALKSRDTSNLALVTGAGNVLRPNPPLASSADPEFDPRSISPIPPVLGTDVDASRQFYRQGVSQVRMPPLPTQAKIAVGAQAASQAQQVVSESILLETNNKVNPVQTELNITGSGVSYGPGPGQVQIATGGGDDLTHGTEPPVWETDPAYISLRDDFVGHTAISGSPATPNIGDLGWATIFTTSVSSLKYYQAGNYGLVELGTGSSASLAGTSIILGGADATRTIVNGFPLTYVSGWDACFAFRWPKFLGAGGTTALNPSTKVRFYLGFAGATVAGGASSSTPRPAKFIGLRLDTDPQAWTLASVANSSGSTAAYTGNFTGAAANALVGQFFTVTGFVAHTSNNGTFVCTANAAGGASTTITLANASAISETQAATATGTVPFSDATYKYEGVQNGPAGSNIQGTVVDSTISPGTDGKWHRFRMRSLVAGTILFSIDGGTESSITVGPEVVNIGASPNEMDFTRLLISGGSQVTAANSQIPGYEAWSVCAGTLVTIAGLTGGTLPAFNGSWTVTENSSVSNLCFDTSSIASNAGGFSSTGTISCHNSLAPFMMLMNDSEGTNASKIVDMDFFSFIWNTNLGSNAPGSPDPTKARYW